MPSLADQLIAAKLNIQKGASVPATVLAAIAAADALIGGRTMPPIGNGSLKPADASSLTSILDAYNNGLVEGGSSARRPSTSQRLREVVRTHKRGRHTSVRRPRRPGAA